MWNPVVLNNLTSHHNQSSHITGSHDIRATKRWGPFTTWHKQQIIKTHRCQANWYSRNVDCDWLITRIMCPYDSQCVVCVFGLQLWRRLRVFHAPLPFFMYLQEVSKRSYCAVRSGVTLRGDPTVTWWTQEPWQHWTLVSHWFSSCGLLVERQQKQSSETRLTSLAEALTKTILRFDKKFYLCGHKWKSCESLSRTTAAWGGAKRAISVDHVAAPPWGHLVEQQDNYKTFVIPDICVLKHVKIRPALKKQNFS